MSTTTVGSGPTLDVSGTPGIPTSRLVAVEMRKLVDTRASRWLLAVIAVVTLAVVVIFYLVADAQQRTYVNFIAALAPFQGFLLPVLGILLVTQEWTQRTGLVTFTMVPSRGRVITAKVVASVLMGLAAIVLAMALAAVGTLIGGASHGFTGIGADDLGKFVMLETLAVLQGLAFGLLFLNSAAAIVVYLVVPQAFTILANIWGALRDAAPWIDLNTAETPLQTGTHLAAQDWAHLASAVGIWVVLPFVLGLVRVLRAEVK